MFKSVSTVCQLCHNSLLYAVWRPYTTDMDDPGMDHAENLRSSMIVGVNNVFTVCHQVIPMS